MQCSFTRDYDAVRAKLATVEERDKTVLEAALHGVSALVSEEWGLNTCCHVRCPFFALGVRTHLK